MRSRYEEDDDDEVPEDWEGEPFEDEEEEEAFKFRDLCVKQISRDLGDLGTRELLEFLIWEMERLQYTEKTELCLIGITFDKQYILEFYNVREDSTVKTGTMAGNIYSLIDGWILKTLSELYIDELYSDLQDLDATDLVDPILNIMLDIEEWRQLQGFDGEAPDDDEDEDDDDQEIIPGSEQP